MPANHLRKYLYAASLLVFSAGLAFVPELQPIAMAQNATTGGIAGTATDSTGAAVPNADIKIVDLATQETRVVKSEGSGHYVASFLKPGKYSITASTGALFSEQVDAEVLIGQQAQINLSMTPTRTTEVVTVEASAAQLIDREETSLTTTFTEQQVQVLPAGGNDITTVAYTVPGAIVNAGGSYGNFSVNGLPGISNLFVLNGFDDVDPFLNLNNSGSSNLTLGQEEVNEASVVTNGYSAQYGRAAGAIINYTTKSGTNSLHGNLSYFYNGDVLNANDWFRNNNGASRQKAVSNEWGANVGGPIIKDKLFFDADYEGLHYVLPVSGTAVFPSPQFEAYTLANVPAAAQPFYQQQFALYNGSPNYAGAVPVTTGGGSLQDQTGGLGCDSGFAGTPDGAGGVFGQTTPCEYAAQGSGSNKNIEWLFTGRADWNVSAKDKIFFRYKMDRGSQPTYTSFTSPVFNAVSIQPEYEGQLNDTYSATPNLVNQFIFATDWYTAFFGSANQAATLAAFPTYTQFYSGGTNSATQGSLGQPYYFPQGRNVTQYQFVDDLSWLRGNHNFKFGYNFRRDDVSDFDAQVLENGLYLYFDQASYASGGFSEYLQNFPTQKTSYLALYNLGAYAQDEWQASHNLKVTYGIRFDRTGNPLCNNSCFSSYQGRFPQYATGDTPYNQGVLPNQPQPFGSVEGIIAQPRIGFNYDVAGDGKTIIRGGYGLFADLYPATLLDGLIQNFPGLYAATVYSGISSYANVPGSAGYNAAAVNTAIQAGFGAGQSPNQIATTLAAQGVPFTPPNFVAAPSKFKQAKYNEFNLQIQRQLGRSDAIIVGYVGNTGYNEFIEQPKANASLQYATGVPAFGNLPQTSPDQRFLQVNQYLNGANSNYNGGSVTYKHIDRHGITVDLTYTYSHSLDEISNGGAGEYFNTSSITTALAPGNFSHLNYSSSDYDVRNSFNADYVYVMPRLFSSDLMNSIAGGWTFAGKNFYRSGQPFSVIDSALPGNVLPTAGGQILATVAGPVEMNCNLRGNQSCFTAANFVAAKSETGFGNLPRNSFRGPHYNDFDFALTKKLINIERISAAVGANAFNVFNHPNFGFPGADVNSSSLGSVSTVLSPPTSPYGSFQGSAVSGRVLQVFAKVDF